MRNTKYATYVIELVIAVRNPKQNIHESEGYQGLSEQRVRVFFLQFCAIDQHLQLLRQHLQLLSQHLQLLRHVCPYISLQTSQF